MKFRVQVRDFIKGLEPVVSVATKGALKEYDTSFLSTLVADKDGITGLADGGRVSMYAHINNSIFDKLSYENISSGSATVKAVDLKATLESIDENEMVTVELDKSNSEDTENDLIITFDSDPEQYQTLPTFRERISIDEEVTKYLSKATDDDALEIRRDLFASAASQISFAHGFEEYRPAYLYWLVKAKSDEIRFASGSGGRFVVLEYLGKNLTNVSEETDLLVPNEQTQVFINVLSKVSDDMVKLYKTNNHLLLQSSSYVAIAANYNPEVKWPDLDIYLARENRQIFTTRVGSWPNAVKGLQATYNEDAKKAHDYHVANLDIDFENNVVTAQTRGSVMRSKRKIKIDDSYIADATTDKEANINFLSKYLFEAFKNVVDDEYVQFELEDELKPVVIRYHASQSVGDHQDFRKPNEVLGVDERMTIFFATFKEEE